MLNISKDIQGICSDWKTTQYLKELSLVQLGLSEEQLAYAIENNKFEPKSKIILSEHHDEAINSQQELKRVNKHSNFEYQFTKQRNINHSQNSEETQPMIGSEQNEMNNQEQIQVETKKMEGSEQNEMINQKYMQVNYLDRINEMRSLTEDCKKMRNVKHS